LLHIWQIINSLYFYLTTKRKEIMKKIAMIALFAGAFAFASCNSATTEDSHDHDHDHEHDHDHDHDHDDDSTTVALDSLASE